MDRSQSFYEHFGFAPVPGRHHEDADVTWRYFRLPGSDTLLELLHYKGPRPETSPSDHRHILSGLNHIGFHVRDLEAIRERLDALGAPVVETGERHGYRFLFARGPDGEPIGFAEFD